MAVRREGNTANRPVVIAQDFDLLQPDGIPHDYCLVVAGSREPFTVRAKSDCVNCVCVISEGLQALTSRKVPDYYLTVFSRGNQQAPIW
jgi:hypothetical protein